MHDIKIIISSLESSPVPQNNRVLPCVCVPKKSSLPQTKYVLPKMFICSPHILLVPKIIDNLQSPKVIDSCPKNHLFPKIIDNLLFPKGYTSSPK